MSYSVDAYHAMQDQLAAMEDRVAERDARIADLTARLAAAEARAERAEAAWGRLKELVIERDEVTHLLCCGDRDEYDAAQMRCRAARAAVDAHKDLEGPR